MTGKRQFPITQMPASTRFGDVLQANLSETYSAINREISKVGLGAASGKYVTGWLTC
jgi:hypothetical protein